MAKADRYITLNSGAITIAATLNKENHIKISIPFLDFCEVEEVLFNMLTNDNRAMNTEIIMGALVTQVFSTSEKATRLK
jgi:hypothetical protein